MKTMPFHKYHPYPGVDLPGRRWPERRIVRAPRWCSVDLRDGNQALSTPMGIEAKLELFRLLVAIGFREIEVGFPSAAEVEFAFTRRLIEEGHIPEGVAIQVLVPARETLIRRTFEAVRGARDVIVHLYNPTSEVQRRIVFRKDRAGIVRVARDAAALMASLRGAPGLEGMRFQYSPESFQGTEPDFALDICHAVMDIWAPTPERPVIINLPQTVEAGTPNLYADRIEWFGRHVRARDSIVLSAHTHNDRGCAVAAAELAVMAGADRVEGALFGNGERTGNMDIITMALNLFTQGVDPELDFADIDHVGAVYTRCTGMEVPLRHPYAGDLVYTAFSGSHQDAIHKGLAARQQDPDGPWEVPYLPVDPADVGRSYEAVIRINSQSGKGGVAYVLEHRAGFHVPVLMRPEVAAAVQRAAEARGMELTPEEVVACFQNTYLDAEGPYRLGHCAVVDEGSGVTSVDAVVHFRGQQVAVRAQGNGPVDAFIHGLRAAFGLAVDVTLFEEHALDRGADARAAAYLGLRQASGQEVWGAGIDASISVASLKAVVSALNRM